MALKYKYISRAPISRSEKKFCKIIVTSPLRYDYSVCRFLFALILSATNGLVPKDRRTALIGYNSPNSVMKGFFLTRFSTEIFKNTKHFDHGTKELLFRLLGTQVVVPR